MGTSADSRTPAWHTSAVARLNVFHGFADKARLAEARAQAARRAFDTEKVETMARLDVQIAIARLEAARASETVGQAAAERARESSRIIRDRYESGLTDAAMLLRAADAVQQAEAQQIAARVNVLVPIFIIFTVVQMSAWIVLGLWFLYQFLIGLQELAGPSGIAWMAHVGGFVFGFVVILLLGGRPRRRPQSWRWGT